MRVLVIEDDAATRQTIEMMFKCERAHAYSTDLGEEGYDLARLYDYDLITLDLNLPDMSGYEVLRKMRNAKVKTPVIIVSGMAGIEDKVKAFDLGADDYITKPFHKAELIARANAIVRRAAGHAHSIATFGDLAVNFNEQSAAIAGVPIHLTAKEFTILELLARKRGSTVSKEQIMNHVYGGMDEPELKIIDVFICKLRRKLCREDISRYIGTIWGRGYIMREPVEVETARAAGEVAQAISGLNGSAMTRDHSVTAGRSSNQPTS